MDLNEPKQHSINVRMKEDTHLYNSKRDVAHNFKYVVTTLAERLEKRTWKEVHELLLDPYYITDHEMGEACQAFIKFVAGATENPKEEMLNVLDRSGFMAVAPAARVAYMASLGVILSGIYFQGVREVTLGGEGPCSDVKDLMAAGNRAYMLITAPPWKRPWIRLKNRIRKFRNALRA